jgi:hypothetical protein
VWLLTDDHSNRDRIVAALAAGREHVDKFDYVLIDRSAATQLSVKIVPQKEQCPDEHASAQWHLNMVELTGTQLHGIVRAAYAAQQTGRILEPQVEALIRAGVARGELDRRLVNTKLLESLGL